MKEKKPKIKKIKEPKVKKAGGSLLFTGLSLLLTIIMFVGLIFLQDYLSEKITYKQIVVAKKDIPENEIITEENIEKYFTIKSINILDTTSGALSDANTLLGKKSIIPLYMGEAVTEKDFENISAYTENIKNPIEVSVKIPDIANADGGKIREGDLVNLTMMFTKAQLSSMPANASDSSRNDSDLYDTFITDKKINNDSDYINDSDFIEDADFTEDTDFIEEPNTEEAETDELVNKIDELTDKTDELVNKEDSDSDKRRFTYELQSQYVLENLYVKKVLDSSGIEIIPTDKDSSAGIIIFTIEKEKEAELNNALSNCSSLRISKIINK